ncbi:putative bifunctional diguanylate cyclase/phosphodiesterase [Devosia beringensis]|uniref:putative bifunctional diguanylate cyclase/phosphodiesterase n=1 Tax=Devosia beringensis TaxID=2657486 RepID=UPI00186B909B|nr:EAL domain-containing protein [Devosia beringensis]
MSALESIRRLFAVPDDPDLVLAQARALSRQVPLMYVTVVVNTLILGATHIGTAPDALTLYVPAILTVSSVLRILHWWQARGALQDLARARQSLRQMMRVMPVLSLGFTLWTIGLLPYGDPYQQSQVVFFCGITTIACMFCLMHVRAAALTMGGLTLFPFIIVMLTMGNVVLTAIALNLVAVVAAMLIILLGNYRDFSALVSSRSAMAHKQAETQRLSDENDRLANVDPLTGLPNRRWFYRRLNAMLDEASRNDVRLAVARVDLDGFKSINEIFGQITGDHVLAEVGRRIVTLCPPGALVARLEADNFALILSGPLPTEALESLGRVMCHALSQSFELPGATIHLSASMGLAAARPGDTAETAYDRADYATSVAKREHRGSAVVFAERHEREISQVRRIEHELRTADLDSEIAILFQPQFDIALGCTTGFEVLARWRSPVLGDVSPVEFIPLAERTGLICKVTQTVLRQALAASARLPRHMRLSVNLSAHDIGSTAAIQAIVAMVEAAGTPCRIDFEITETAVMRDMGQANASLLALLALGSRIALDDFGTGHSSLTHVQQLPLDRIKVDRSFVAEICNDTTSQAIIKTTADLCRNLGISCVFEGVETRAQLDALAALGGTVMQGYLFGRPIDEASMQAQLALEQAHWHAQPHPAYGAAR